MSRDPDGTEKIYITMPKRYVRALEIIAGDPKQKSTWVEKLIDFYINEAKDELRERGIYDTIQESLKIYNDSIEERIEFIDKYIENHPIPEKKMRFQEVWNGIGKRRDDDALNTIDFLYNKIKEETKKNLDSLFS